MLFLPISFGTRTFMVQVLFSEKRHLSLRVYPDCSIVARVPKGNDVEKVSKIISRKASWIVKQLDFFSNFPLPQPERRYVSGETHRYLGRQYRLKIRQGEKGVRLIGHHFEITVPDPHDARKIKMALDAWYREHTISYISSRIEHLWPRFERTGIQRPPLIFRKMKTRWGSCSPQGRITFNTELIKAPSDCIDYVIVHELCHLKYPKHDRVFYRLLERIMPDWETRKKRLEQMLW